MTTQEKLKEVEKRIKNSTSYKNKRDLLKHKKRLLKQLKKEKKINEKGDRNITSSNQYIW